MTKQIVAGRTEWRWSQPYKCGHSLRSTMMSDVRTGPFKTKIACPKCKLAYLMSSTEDDILLNHEMAQESIEAVRL